MYRILVCDDEKDIVSALKIYLTTEGYEVFPAYNGRQAVELMRTQDIDLVLMDIMMPDLDGLSAMEQLRQFSNVPVLLLTAKSEDEDKIQGLDVGADDYITKPFSPAEVLARVRSHLRRYTRLGSSVNLNQPLLLRCGGIELDREARQVTCDGDAVALTPREYDILLLLMQNIGKVFSPREIYQQVWREMPMGAENVIAVHIRHLREKLEINPAEPRYLKVVWGQGYKLEEGKG